MADQHSFGQIRVYDSNGNPVPGALAYFYTPGTTALVDTFADEGLTIFHPSPLVSDAGGVFPQVFSGGEIKCNVTTAVGGTVPGYPIDPVPRSIGDQSAAGGVTFAPTLAIPATDVQAAIELVDSQLSGDITAAGLVTVTGAGLATGGGNLTANRVITVTAATQAQNEAGTIATAIVTPLGVRESLKATGTAPIFAARAWVNFNGTTGTIRSSGNVSSITVNGTGDYTINFATAMQDANYAVIGSAGADEILGPDLGRLFSDFGPAGRTVSSCRVCTAFASQAVDTTVAADASVVSVAIFR